MNKVKCLVCGLVREPKLIEDANQFFIYCVCSHCDNLELKLE